MSSAPLEQPERPEDALLLAALGDLHDQLDPVPEHVRLAARAAIELRDLDAELLPLLEAEAGALVRGEPAAPGSRTDHWFSFALDDVEVELGARRGRTGWDLVGQVSAPVRALSVQTMTETDQVPVDELGRFSATVSAPTLRLRLVTPSGRALRTEWVTL
ncbi:hypothetical protein [Angustibacter aerolatus]